MPSPLSRILSAVPQTWHVYFEIAEAVQTLAAPDQASQQQPIKALSAELDSELIKEFACELRREFLSLIRSNPGRGSSATKAAVDDPKHPGWPAHTPEGKGGQFRPKDESLTAADEPSVPPPGIGHNQGPPLEEPPAIPVIRPATRRALNLFIQAAAFWLAVAEKKAAAKFLLALQGVVWLRDSLQWIRAYNDPPKTLGELQQDAQNPQPGYNIHHIVEQTPATRDGFSDSMIDGPENLVRIPTLKHWQITAWYQTSNPKFDGLSPRDYLRGKSWDERRKFGLETLIDFGVLKP